MPYPWAFSLLIPFLFTRSLINDVTCRVRSTRSTGAKLDLVRCSAHDADLAELMSHRRPIIIEGLADKLGFRHTADLKSLRAVAKSQQTRFPVKIYNSASPYFLYTGDYGQILEHTEEMSLEKFLDRMFDKGGFPEQVIYRQFGRRELDGAAGIIIDDMADTLAKVVHRQPEKDASGIWIGSRGAVTPLHYDAWPGLLFQTHGAKRVLMFSPDDIPNLYFMPQFAVGTRWSKLPGRSREAGTTEFLRFSKATRFEGTLEAGETLFIPPFWPHEIEALEPNISVPFRFGLAKAEYLNPRFLRPACEVFHGKYLKGWFSRQ